MDLTRQFMTSYPVIGRGGPLQTGFPLVGGLAPGGPELNSSAVVTPSAGESSPGAASSSPGRRRASHVSPRAPAGCFQPPPLPQTTHLAAEPTATPLCTNLFSPTTGPQMSKHLNFGWVDNNIQTTLAVTTNAIRNYIRHYFSTVLPSELLCKRISYTEKSFCASWMQIVANHYTFLCVGL